LAMPNTPSLPVVEAHTALNMITTQNMATMEAVSIVLKAKSVELTPRSEPWSKAKPGTSKKAMNEHTMTKALLPETLLFSHHWATAVASGWFEGWLMGRPV